jgi:hypothetical protein
MSEYVYSWRVQAAYDLTNEQRRKLVSSLAPISGAAKEYFSWCLVTTPSVRSVSPSADIITRATLLHQAMLKLLEEHVYQARGILRDVVVTVYEEERPEMETLPEEFSQKPDFPQERFWLLYLDTLLLRLTDVRTYCRENQIRQIREVKGLLMEDEPWPPPQLPTNAPIAGPHPEAQALSEAAVPCPNGSPPPQPEIPAEKPETAVAQV